MNILTETQFELNVIDEFKGILGYQFKQNVNAGDRTSFFDYKILKEKIILLNEVNEVLAEKAIMEIKKISDNAIESNKVGFDFLVNGIKVYDEISKRTVTLKIVSDDIDQNDWVVTNQYRVSDGVEERIPDIVVFLNGLPISILELKAPNASERLEDAFKQNDSLKRFVPSLYTFNVFDFLSNNLSSVYGSITSGFKRYFKLREWNDEKSPIRFLYDKQMILDIIKQFTFFDNAKEIKYLAAPHQIEAVNKTIERLKTGTKKGGVVWHTQGSGKSVTMLMLTKAIITNFPLSTTMVVTDRKSLDKQLFGRFSQASEYLLSKPTEIKSRNDLKEKLANKASFDIYFSTIQKFTDETGVLSNRDDIFILIDEAHRTQNNIDGNKVMDTELKEFLVKYGYAKFMRNAFPFAALTGFTGTPLMSSEKSTTDIFGSYTHKYSMNDSVADGSTVPILYESRKLELFLNKEHLKEMDEIQSEYFKTLKRDSIQDSQKMESLLKSVQRKLILEDNDVIVAKSKDILNHLRIRSNVLHGKAMIVATSRKAAFRYKKAIESIEPERNDSTILVMTSSNKDSEEMKAAIVQPSDIEKAATEFRKPDSKYKIAIVVDMWLTGFDVPDLDVMYLDKIIKWHNLMQAIARVNRTYEDKDGTKASGLIVDYLGIWKHLSDALIQYAGNGEGGIEFAPEDVEKALTTLEDMVDVIESEFIPELESFISKDPKSQYNFIMDAFGKLLALDDKEKNKFIQLARKIKRLLKMVFTIVEEDIAKKSKAIEVVNALLSTSNTLEDDELKLTIEAIKRAIAAAVDSKSPEVNIKATKINKDINQVVELLEEEAEQLMSSNPLVAKKLLIDAINSKIKDAIRIRPVFAKRASDKLQDILNEMDKEEDIARAVEVLLEFSKEISKTMNEDPEFADPQLQAFFTILADEERLTENQNSEMLKMIAIDLMEAVKGSITDQFYRSKKVKDQVTMTLMKILRNKYNYPPKRAGGVSGILINKITETIEYNPMYFVDKKEVI